MCSGGVASQRGLVLEDPRSPGDGGGRLGMSLWSEV